MRSEPRRVEERIVVVAGEEVAVASFELSETREGVAGKARHVPNRPSVENPSDTRSRHFSNRQRDQASRNVSPMHFPLRTATVFMLVLSLGLHWALLQTVAWTGMLVTYSRDSSFQEAVSKTFDGEHPCALCRVIKSGRAEEGRQEQQQLKPAFKLDLAPVWQATEFDFACGRDAIPSHNLVGPSRADEPPKPHPRGRCDNHARA